MDKKVYLALMIIAIIILTINIILTIMEALRYYHLTYHVGRMKGASGDHKGASDTGPDGRIKICGMWYNVYWIVVGREGLISLEERGVKSGEKDK